MKKIFKGYYIASGILLLIGITDFWHYARVGQNLLAHYEGAGIIQKLVHNTLFQGIIAVIMAGVILLVGWLRRDAGKKKCSTLFAVGVRITAAVLGLWILCTAALTYGTAQYIFRDLVDTGYDLPEKIGDANMLSHLYYYSEDGLADAKNTPGLMDSYMLQGIYYSGAGVSAPSFVGYPALEDDLNVFRDANVKCDTAVVFRDWEGNVLHKNGDYVYFSYVSEESWEEFGFSQLAEGYGWLDLSDESDTRYEKFREIYDESKGLYFLEDLRLTGYFDGSRFEPYAIAVADTTAYDEAVDALIPWDELESGTEIKVEVSEDGKSATVSMSGGDGISEEILGKVDRESLLTWDVWFDKTSEVDPGQELVTIYADRPKMYVYEETGAVRYRSETHGSLLELLLSMDYYRDGGAATFYSGASQFSLWNLIVFSERSFIDDTGRESGEPYPEPDFTIMTAMRASPILIAAKFLRNVYIVTGVFAALCILLLIRRVKRSVVEPVREINESMAGGFTNISSPAEKAPKWAEQAELYENYLKTLDTLRFNKNEIARLDKALDYAKKAEESRRQMTSNIAHELKTPLAVVHSYAEGLKERIAEDKREKYIDVILSETERMDSMVLEMPDLSRLEAGRVKLARDTFSLEKLVREAFERLEKRAEEKRLNITFDFPEDSTVTADESRISQVVENFASNAVKYTPEEGGISVRVVKDGGKTTFYIANDCEPMTPEELSKVWDTFYRRDESRTGGGGTGLGLAIAKSIIELHGGTCGVRNTKTGVEFSFTI